MPTEVINLRVPEEQKILIDSAAKLLGKTRTAFILEQVVRHAEEVLAEDRHFELSPEEWCAFQRALDAPVRPNPSLSRLLATPAPWEK